MVSAQDEVNLVMRRAAALNERLRTLIRTLAARRESATWIPPWPRWCANWGSSDVAGDALVVAVAHGLEQRLSELDDVAVAVEHVDAEAWIETHEALLLPARH